MASKKHSDKISLLIEFFIKKPIDRNTFNIKGEATAGSKLIKRYPDFDFFYHLPDLTDKFNSLFGLLNKKTLDKLDIEYEAFLLKKKSKPKEYILENEPVIKIEYKTISPPSLLDFLRN